MKQLSDIKFSTLDLCPCARTERPARVAANSLTWRSTPKPR